MPKGCLIALYRENTMNTLSYARIMAAACNEMISQLGLGNLGIRVDGEDTSSFTSLDDEVRYYQGGRLVAVAEVSDNLSSATPHFNVYIQWFDIYTLIRDEHVSEFTPSLYGLHVNKGRNWLGEKLPDLEVECDVDPSLLRTGPPRPLPKTQYNTGNIKVKGSV